MSARALLVCLSLIISGHALAENDNFLVFGIGLSSCAHWQSTPSRQREGAIWIYGYWSAANHIADTQRQTGRHTDADGIVGEVKKVCDTRPSMGLVEAAGIAYFNLSKR